MVKPSERRLNKKFIKVPSGKTKSVRYKEASKKKSICGLCSKGLQGTPRGNDGQKGKLSKTEKRPSILFGGVLCNKCRDAVFENTIKVKTGLKKITDVKVGMRKYVAQAMNAVKL